MTSAKRDIRRVRGIITIVFVAPLAAAACGGGDGASRAAPVTAAGPAAIDVVRVVEQALDVPLSLPGELTAFQSVAMFPRVTGFVKSVNVDRGSKVRAGELLALLEAPEVVAQRSEAQSKLRAAEAQLSVARAKADADKGTFARLKAASATPGVVAGNDVVIAEKTADGSANQVLAAEQSVEAARQALNAIRDMEGYLRMTAPFAGVITERNVHPGALVGPSTSGAGATPLLRLVDTDRLRLVVPVPEAYTAEMRPGAEIPFTVAAYPGRSFSGKVARIAQAVDVSTRTMAVELDVANGDGRLAPGTFCQVRWPVRRSGPSLFVPSASVATTTDRTFVIRIRNGKTEWVDVKTGLTSGPLVEVFGDLRAGDEIAGRGTDELRPGTEVRPRESKPAA
ncbi:MAG TPA: efflux RND transporter periplasmic adaptor subunit [Vicinamibacterales bacterium]|nr:efflux RND transporter periplasmic adaptor subunit [Vicinamibacterales bacterium]